jgi:general secretion pathway protein F
MSIISAALVTRPVTLPQLAALSDEIAALARAGVPLDRGLKELGRELPGRVGAMSIEISRRLEAGQPLDDIVGDLGARLPDAYRHVLLVGLKAGRLPAALESVAHTARRVSELRQSMGLALIYPLIVLSLTWVLGLFVMVQIAPVMVRMLTEFNVTSPEVEAVFESLVRWLPMWGVFVPVLFAIYLAWVWFRSGQAARGMDLHPLLSFGALATLARLQRAARGASLAELLVLLANSGVPLPDAVELASAAVGSKGIAAGGRELAQRLARGEAVGQLPRGFPPLIAWTLAAGYSQPQLLRSLARTAEVYRDEVARRTQWLSFYAPLVLTILVCGGVVLIYAALTLGPWLAIMQRLTFPYQLFF